MYAHIKREYLRSKHQFFILSEWKSIQSDVTYQVSVVQCCFSIIDIIVFVNILDSCISKFFINVYIVMIYFSLFSDFSTLS